MALIGFYRRIRSFMYSGTGSGTLLITCVIVSLIIANSSFAAEFEKLLGTELGYRSDRIQLRYSLQLWINDGLMAIFFLLVGLEIKRELVDGGLSTVQQASLPVFGAIGGVVFPALIFTLLNSGTATARGWAIPMATDIAFALAIITLLGKKVPLSLKVFLAALAIVDDLMAIVVIAIFYSSDLHYNYLLYAGLVFSVLLGLNRLGVQNIFIYILPGILIWYLIHHSGIHATIAGVLTALAIPTKRGANGESPLIRLEHVLARPVNLVIMPVFALANTNITFGDDMVGGLFSSLGMGVIFGLVIGKPLGIFLSSWLAVKLRICILPDHSNWKHMAGVGMLAGIGFTMSIFIALLSFSGNESLMSEAKFAVLVASVVSGAAGSVFLTALRKNERSKAIRSLGNKR